jgi:mono/diheme cytochrome c family protein
MPTRILRIVLRFQAYKAIDQTPSSSPYGDISMQTRIRHEYRLSLALLLCVFAWSASAEDLASYTGAELYGRFCASCHGADAAGDGPVAPMLKVMVPDLRLISRRQGGKYPAETIRRIIDGRDTRPPHGPRDMPVWGYEFAKAGADSAAARQQSQELIDRLVKHLSTLQKN